MIAPDKVVTQKCFQDKPFQPMSFTNSIHWLTGQMKWPNGQYGSAIGIECSIPPACAWRLSGGNTGTQLFAARYGML